MFGFFRSRVCRHCKWRARARTKDIDRLHKEFERRFKTQTILPSAETAPNTFWDGSLQVISHSRRLTAGVLSRCQLTSTHDAVLSFVEEIATAPCRQSLIPQRRGGDENQSGSLSHWPFLSGGGSYRELSLWYSLASVGRLGTKKGNGSGCSSGST
jgi:hypothetical protein